MLLDHSKPIFIYRNFKTYCVYISDVHLWRVMIKIEDINGVHLFQKKNSHNFTCIK